MSVDVSSARRDWADGWQRLQEASREPAEAARLERQLEVVTDELRRRVGATFTTAQLAGAYAEAEPWVRAAVAEHAPAPGWPRSLAVVQDAAFHLYARGALDYEP